MVCFFVSFFGFLSECIIVFYNTSPLVFLVMPMMQAITQKPVYYPGNKKQTGSISSRRQQPMHQTTSKHSGSVLMIQSQIISID